MADVSVNVGVKGISQFKQGISEANASIKTFDAALKANEKALKADGDAEKYMQAQTTVLNGKLQAQQKLVENAEAALKQMAKNGVKETSTAFQDMQRKLIEAHTAMMDTQDQLDNLGNKAEETGEKAKKLESDLGGLNKKVSLEQVIGAVNSITTGLENAAKKAVDLGQKLWDTIMDSARRADDTATLAAMYDIPLETYLRMMKLVGNGMDTSVDAMLGAQDKLKKGIGSESNDIMSILRELNLLQTGMEKGGGTFEIIPEDSVELFWEAGQAIMNMDNAYKQESAAQKLFGKSWKELSDLFTKYKSLDEYNAALEEQTVNSEESIRDLAALNDAVSKLESSWTTLKDEMLGAIAPALTKGADAISGLLDSLTEYLKTEEGQQMLDNLGKAVEGLFKDISEIDPQEVVKGFSGVLNTIVDGVKWISDNSGTVIGALEAIVIGWGALKLTGGALEIVKLIEGISGLASGGAAAAAGEAGAAAGTAWGASFASAVMTAAPWLVGLYTLLKPAESAGNDLDAMYANGKVTTAGWEYWNNNPEQWYARTMAVGNRYGDLSTLLGDEAALNIIGNLTLTDEEVFKQLEEQLGVKPLEVPYEMTPYEDVQEEIREQVGTVVVDAMLKIIGVTGGGQMGLTAGGMPKGGGGGGPARYVKGYANGLWSVPFDNYPALLHKNERVVPAREIESRNYSSNLYVERMYMNNGQDAEGLAAAIAEAQRRTSAGYGN